MSEEILINVTPPETRVAVVENGVVQELIIERTAKRIKQHMQRRFNAMDAGITVDQWVILDLLNQTDGIHPTAEGYGIIVDNIYPYVVEAIQKYQNK